MRVALSPASGSLSPKKNQSCTQQVQSNPDRLIGIQFFSRLDPSSIQSCARDNFARFPTTTTRQRIVELQRQEKI